MRTRALSALFLLPLAACFDVVIPEEPEPAPAELDNGEWIFEIEQVSMSGDCYTYMPDDIDDMPVYATWAWIETHGERGVSIDLEGAYLEGEIHGDALEASGSVDLYGDYDEPYGESEPGHPGDEDDGYGDDDGDWDEPVSSDGGGEADAKCEDEPYPYDERIDVFLAGDIHAPDHMSGEIVVDYVYFDSVCTMEFTFEAEALDDDPCDCECDDDHPEPLVGETEPAPCG